MKNEANQQDTQQKTLQNNVIPAITTVAMPLLIGRRKKMETAEQSGQEKSSKPKQKQKGIAVTKYELSDGIVKFFAAKGFPKKRWVILKEIPIQEITNIDSFGNELSITWNDVVYWFVLKSSESFGGLRDQIQGMLLEQQKTVENTESASLRKKELTEIINGTIDIVDLSFDILMSLHEKRVIWPRLESLVDKLGKRWSFTGQTMMPLNLDFAEVSTAIKRQVPKETSKESYNLLKLIYEYFNSLKSDDDLKELRLNFQNAKDVMLAYYMLNDVLFGKVVGEVDNVEESLALESALLRLVNESSFKVNIEDLRINSFEAEVDGDLVIVNARAIFRDQLKQL